MRVDTSRKHKYFNFSDITWSTLLGLLGESDECFNMLYNFECGVNSIHFVQAEHKHLLSEREQIDKIQAIKEQTRHLINSLSSVTLKTEEDYGLGQKDLSTFRWLNYREERENRKLRPQKMLNWGAMQNNTVLNAVRSLEKLEQGCEFALDSLPTPMRGSRSKLDNQLHHFDTHCVSSYVGIFQGFPAISETSAFTQVMEIIYEEAEFPTSNIVTRLKKAAKEYKRQIQDRPRFNELNATKAVHPPKKQRDLLIAEYHFKKAGH